MLENNEAKCEFLVVWSVKRKSILFDIGWFVDWVMGGAGSSLGVYELLVEMKDLRFLEDQSWCRRKESGLT